MGITVDWDDDSQTMLVWSFDGVWPWETLCDAAEVADELRRKSDYRQAIAVVLDLTKAAPIQTGTLMLDLPRPVEMIDPGVRDMLIFVGRDAFNQKMLATFRRMGIEMGDNLYSVNSLPEASFLVQQQGV